MDTTEAPRAALIGRHDRDGRLRRFRPKGHVEPDETIEEAAVREIAEETGILGRVAAPPGTVDSHHLLVTVGGSPSASEVARVPRRLSQAGERRLIARMPELLASTA